ncbi:hypothetical protein [Falsiroseomonas selenitidurans]|uniref:Secreted protein n=1 Tax=Falsiroseomonas selenitidurans TaxID=2716335 RepID=A0ABX1E785_9PROT|nr:hypothetical protein [Falsiroseomonas selenitidurans]NKC31673.1 hypothetical protein [Falsiroseomonas selenitidurans]
MRKILLVAAMLGSVAGVPAASAWEAQSSLTGPQGQTATRSGSLNCADGSCTRSGSATGPQGQTATRQRNVTRTAPGQWSAQGTATGRRGGTATRSGSVQRGW